MRAAPASARAILTRVEARTVGGAYRVTGLLGGGFVSHVFAGVEVQTGRMVAIKMARRRDDGGAALALLRHEAALLARLRSPHLPALIAFHDGDDGEAALVYGLIDGPTIPPGRRALGEVRPIVADVATGLDALHAGGIVHCDVQPQNLLATGDGRVTLIDLNVARPVGTGSGGQFVGCPPYMAPELWRGEPVWPATDAYALAALVFALAAGAPPFQGSSTLAQMRAHLEEQPPSLASRGVSAPARAEEAVAAALAKDPAARPKVRELCDAL